MSNLSSRNKYFDEKHYETSRENADKFDIIIRENSCSSFRDSGVLCDNCFNSALIETMQKFSALERLNFVNYQLNKYKDPLDWLKRTKAFLYDNEDEFGSFNHKAYREYQQIIDAGIAQLSEPNSSKKKRSKTDNGEFVDLDRIEELKEVTSTKFDLKKLIKYCEELNLCYETEAYLSVAMLTRALIDHIPPIFGADNFQN